jgi:hypothetical protein
VGQAVTVTAKVENTGAAEEPVRLTVEDLKEGALGKPLVHAMDFEPASVGVPPKSRRVVTFAWKATLPEGRDAHTFRGKLVLRHARTGQLVGEAALDVYVRRS